jgi:hypothetical protein
MGQLIYMVLQRSAASGKGFGLLTLSGGQSCSGSITDVTSYFFLVTSEVFDTF